MDLFHGFIGLRGIRDYIIKRSIMKRFKDLNAKDELSAVTLEQLRIPDDPKVYEKVLFDYLHASNYVVEKEKRYYLDEAYIKKFRIIMTIIFALIGIFTIGYIVTK